MGANELSAQLWRQRELLELLLFKYEEERLLLAAGKTRWIPQATREIEKVVERLKEASLSLSVALVDVAKVWQLPDGALLRDVVNAAPELMWRDIFNEHLNALIGLITEIGEQAGNLAAQDRQVVLAGLPDRVVVHPAISPMISNWRSTRARARRSSCCDTARRQRGSRCPQWRSTPRPRSRHRPPAGSRSAQRRRRRPAACWYWRSDRRCCP